MCPPNESGAYLSDDLEARLRMQAPVQCRLCTHLVACRSVLTEGVVIHCTKPQGEDMNAEILGVLLMDLAKRDSCTFCSPFKGLL